jgi:hypothetical protein
MNQKKEIIETKKRGRKKGSKNKVKSKRTTVNNGYSEIFKSLENEMSMVMGAIQKAQELAAKQIEKLEAKHTKDIAKVKDKSDLSIKIWKERAKEYRQKMLNAGSIKKRSVGRPASLVAKPPVKRGRPIKVGEPRRGGGRKKEGELTKKDIILNFMRNFNNEITSKELIKQLFLLSGESDAKRYSQGIYTTLTQIYKTGELLNNGGFITVSKK